jgi:hypothetical protein
MIHQLAPIGLFDAAAYSGAKLHFLLNEAQGSVYYHLFGVGSPIASDPRKLSFLLGREMHFHRF